MFCNHEPVFILFKKLLLLPFLLVFMGFNLIFTPTVKADTRELDPTSLSFDDLLNMEVTSAAKKPQKLSETAAAAFIITQEDIKRVGVTNVMDALRMAPGIQVAQIDGNKWAITSRGFNGRFANKLLVLIDGRTIYDPLFSGVLWEAQDIPLEDIDKIEIIRGPGASVWGANAVNGIINIMTKSAKATKGALASAGGGTHEKIFGFARYGGQIGENTYYRLSAKLRNRDSFDEVSGNEGNNDLQSQRFGFRMDGNPSEFDNWSFQGGVHTGEAGESYMTPILEFPYQMPNSSDAEMEGAHLLGQWTHQLAYGSEAVLQLYYTHEAYDDINAEFKENIVDVDFQHRFYFGKRQEIMWGLAYRYTHLNPEDGLRVFFNTKSQRDDLFSAFFQDEIELVENSLSLTIGSKMEHNDWTGVEIQPTARILWKINEANSFWGSISKAVRTPSWSETKTNYLSAIVPPMPNLPPEYSFPTAVYTIANNDFDSEEVWSYEAGFRSLISESTSLDLSVFYSEYDNLMSQEFAGMSFNLAPVPHTVINGIYANEMSGHSYGIEMAADFVPEEWWKLRLSYTWLKISLDLNDPFAPEYADFWNASPEHQVSLLSMMEIFDTVQFDIWLRYIDSIKTFDIPSYVTMDARVAWNLNDSLEISIVGKNLIEGTHKEYQDAQLATAFTEIERSVYGKLTWWF